jgi:hypothetical protein
MFREKNHVKLDSFSLCYLPCTGHNSKKSHKVSSGFFHRTVMKVFGNGNVTGMMERDWIRAELLQVAGRARVLAMNWC